MGGVAAIDHELTAGHELGFVRREIDDSGCNIIRFADVSYWVFGVELTPVGFQALW